MAAQEYTAVVQQLYISYFGRPADYFGLQNFSEQLDAMGAPKTFAALQAAVGADVAGTSALSQLVNSFNNSAESVALYGNDNSQIGVSKFVAAIYQNVLGREADATGFNFWVDAIASGTLSKANAAAAITAAASTNTSAQGLLDAQTVANKLSVATTFTAALDTPTEFNAYAGDAAAATGRSLLQGVNNTTVVTDYQTAIDDAINTIVNVSVPGDTKSLTTGVDTLVGTAGDDVFNATPVNTTTGLTGNTLTTFDSIDGGAGKDTLNIYTDGTSNILQAGTVKNVETINIFNAEAGTVYGGAAVDASKFVGATAVWQIGRETAITNVGASTTAGFRAIAQADVAVTASAATVGIALDNVTGADATNASIVTVDGTKLTGVTLSGALVENETYAAGTGTDEASVALNATIAKDAQTFTLNSSLNTTLTVDNAATSTKEVTTIAAAASTGNITFDGTATAVSSITTGTGDDTVTLATALTATTKAATVNTGDGDDTITVTATGAADAGSTVTVNAGAGDDEIEVTLDNNVKYNISGGAGDDTITLTGTVKTGDIIDGGEGKDTIGVAGKASYVANDYLAYTKVLKNFEAIKFTTATAGFDASQVAGFKEFTFDSTGSITKVAADQIVTTADALNITAAGYTAAGATGNASSTVYSTDTATGALTVNVVESATVTAKGASIALTVTADSNEAATVAGAPNVLATLAGDVKTATVNLVNGVDADDAAAVASVNVTTAATAAGAGPYTQLGGLTSLTLTGNGSATVVNVANTKLATVDASALASVDAAGDAAAGLTYTSTNAAAETIKLGAGVDVITLNASVYGGVGAAHAWDTVTGLNLVIEGTGAAATYAEGSDELVIGANGWAAAKFTTTETDLDLVLAAAAQNLGARTDNVDALVFTVAGNTYVFADTGTGAGTAGALDAGDTVVQLTGAVDQDDLIVALGLTPAP